MDSGTGTDAVDFRDVTRVVLEDDVTIDTSTGGNTGLDTLFGRDTFVTGDYELIINADGDGDGNVVLGDVSINQLTLQEVDELTLYGDIVTANTMVLADDSYATPAANGITLGDDVRLVTTLAAHLREDEDVTVRATAATSLGRFIRLGELEKIRPDLYTLAYEALLTACQDAEEHMEVRRRTLESLAYVSNETVTTIVAEGFSIGVKMIGPGQFLLTTPPGNPGILKINLPDGKTLNMPPGSGMELSQTATGTVSMTATKGASITMDKLGTLAVIAETAGALTLPRYVATIRPARFACA